MLKHLSNDPPLSSSQEVVFETSGLNFRYPDHGSFALSTGAFRILKGETIALIGPSGGGKSTLLRILEGALLPQNLNQIVHRKRAAMIHQDLRLVNEKTALENALMGALGRQTWTQIEFPPAVKKEALEILELLGLKSHADQTVSMLSGGQKQRVAIARALMSHPEILLADEPFSHLDHDTALETYKLLKKLQDQMGFGLLITTHSNALDSFAFDAIWQVQDGELLLSVQKRSPLEKRPFQPPKITRFEKYFLGVFVILAVASAIQLPTMGLNADGALGEISSFFRKLLVHSPEALSQVGWGFLVQRLWLTLQMAFIGTLLGFLIACPLSFWAAHGVSAPWISYPLRFFLMGLRSIPALVWGLFFVAALGLGPVAGITALAIYSIGYLTKLIYEGIEDLERKPYLALRALGAGRWQAFAHAILPTTRPLLISSFIFMFEYNVRFASLLGLVGAGGIGQDLMYALEWRDFPTVFSILLLVTAVVIILDTASSQLRVHYRKLRGH